MPEPADQSPTPRRMWLWLALCAGVTLLTLMLLGWISYSTTMIYVDCAVPKVEIRIIVLDESGRPVPGVELSLRQNEACSFMQERCQLPLRSDASGQIVLHSVGGEFGGQDRRLFWLIPISDYTTPVLGCELTCRSYRASSFKVDFIGLWAKSGYGVAVGHTVVMRRN